MDTNTFFEELYRDFNDRNIDKVIANMTENVKWANGMDGGHVIGHKSVRDYWTKQFEVVSSNVTPMTIIEENGKVKISVHQVVHDLKGNLLADEMVYHVFSLSDDKIANFDIVKD